MYHHYLKVLVDSNDFYYEKDIDYRSACRRTVYHGA